MAEIVPIRKTDEDHASDDSEALFLRLKRLYRQDLERARIWREEAIEDYRFRDGDQWTTAEREVLREQSRPMLTFNRVGVLVDAVVGSEINNRRDVRFIPREQNDAKPDELLTSAAEWFREQCDAEDEETEAFKDCVTAGMGWTETRLDFTDDPEGAPKIDRIDPFEMVWDRNAQKSNLVDSLRRWRVRRIPIEQARDLIPDVEDEDLNAAWADASEDDREREIDRFDRYDEDDNDDRDAGNDSSEVTLVEAQYYETETFFKVALPDPNTGQTQVVELTEAKHEIAQKQAAQFGLPLKSARMTKRVVMRCFLGATGVLGKPEETQTKTFTYNCITGLKDADKGTFYGIVRRAKDPQRWANKWLSQMMHIMNSQAKGGIVVEEGVFEDIREAEENWAKPDAITVVAKGTFADPNKPKYQPKPQATFPAGFDRLMQYAADNIIQTTGINMELLGMRDATQAGVLEAQRKQSGLTILASLFDSLRRYRKLQGRGMLALIQNYLADGRLVQILGDDQAQYVPLTRESVSSSKYDIIVDDSPSSPNEKERTWGIIQQVLPMIRDAIGPQQGLILAKYSPLPTSLVEQLGQSMKEAQQQQGENPAAKLDQMKLMLEQAKLQNEAEKIAADREKTAADTQIAFMQDQTERRRIDADALKAVADANRPQPQPAAAN